MHELNEEMYAAAVREGSADLIVRGCFRIREVKSQFEFHGFQNSWSPRAIEDMREIVRLH